MNRIVLLLLFISLTSCTSDDSEESSFDMSLLYGQWFDASLCNTQNNISFNNNGTYVRLFSGNSCDTNENDTYQYTGIFAISGDNISFSQETETKIEEGDGNPNTDMEPSNSQLINKKIILLTETELTIESEFNKEPILRNWHLVK